MAKQINSEQWRDMASDYLEGALSEQDRIAVEAHLSGNSESARECAQLRVMLRDLNDLPAVEPPLFFRDNLISRIEATERQRGLSPSFWEWLPRLGRTSLGTLAAAGAGFALAYMVLQPQMQTPPNRLVGNDKFSLSKRGDALSPLLVVLPGRANDAPAQSRPQPRLNVGRVVTLTNNEPAYDFSIWLDNADNAAVRLQFLDDTEPHRFTLAGRRPQTVRVPFSRAGADGVLALRLTWAAEGATRVKYLLIPTPIRDGNAATARPALTTPTVTAIQSFGLPEASVAESARLVAARYNTSITLEDVAKDGRLVRVSAANETAEQTLRRHLKPLGFVVGASGDGILVSSRVSPAPPLSR